MDRYLKLGFPQWSISVADLFPGTLALVYAVNPGGDSCAAGSTVHTALIYSAWSRNNVFVTTSVGFCLHAIKPLFFRSWMTSIVLPYKDFKVAVARTQATQGCLHTMHTETQCSLGRWAEKFFFPCITQEALYSFERQNSLGIFAVAVSSIRKQGDNINRGTVR